MSKMKDYYIGIAEDLAKKNPAFKLVWECPCGPCDEKSHQSILREDKKRRKHALAWKEALA